MLHGYKVYIVCAATLLYAAIGVWNGTMDLQHAVELGLAALGAAGFRSALKKGE
jgi:hypothetical protein